MGCAASVEQQGSAKQGPHGGVSPACVGASDLEPSRSDTTKASKVEQVAPLALALDVSSEAPPDWIASGFGVTPPSSGRSGLGDSNISLRGTKNMEKHGAAMFKSNPELESSEEVYSSKPRTSAFASSERSEREAFDTLPDIDDGLFDADEETDAAVKIQAVRRGQQARQEMAGGDSDSDATGAGETLSKSLPGEPASPVSGALAFGDAAGATAPVY